MKLTNRGRPSARRGVPASRTIKRLSALAVLGVVVLMTSGCSAEQALNFGWPEGVTPEAHDMRVFWTWSVIAALAMGVLVWGLIFWTITFHRGKANENDDEVIPRQTGYNVPLELAYTAIPFVLIAVMFYFTVIVQNKVENKEENPAVVVDVTAFQWNWKFGYNSVNIDNKQLVDAKDSRKGEPFDLQIPKFREHEGEKERIAGAAGGRSAEERKYLSFDKIETLGSSSTIPVLVLPTDTRIQFDLAAADVVHSFWVPEFLFKRDVMPFPDQNHTDSQFQISSIDREGAFVGRCAEMCGTFHAMMNFEVRAVSPADFARYIAYRGSNPEATNAEALQAICQVPESVTTVPFDSRRVSNDQTPSDLGDASNTKLTGCTPAKEGTN
ncbi:cytochrome c oxidase subunit II [Gordonia sp. HY442]|uniref:aa3-type cytochrome oxidase subunit II n=1 Tax=Gordonia zhenghanii TaxID=2911516 RepID=UPI001F38FC92|nr:cytochrome c oxidase subunit II [Gordonia zhenghanii]MCF8605467.1 cytochrome c oxidase subunit II [Gordonia zhenghanii]